MAVDVLIGLQRGDEAKGKIAKSLNSKHKYDAICKYSGGGNSGHTVVIDGETFVRHYLTSAVYSKTSKVILGPGVVINPQKFCDEVEECDQKFDIRKRIFVAPQAHIVSDKHLEDDKKDTKIGTTRQGVGPAMSAKYARTGMRVETDEKMRKYIRYPESMPYHVYFNRYDALMEGSQGWWLDIDHGEYPYVTSSHMHPAHVFTSFGIPLCLQRTIYGAAKGYETYSGFKEDMFGDDEVLSKIQEVGNEVGATTGRPRHVGFLNLDDLVEATMMTGVDIVYISKIDVLEKVGVFCLFHEGVKKHFDDSNSFCGYIGNILNSVIDIDPNGPDHVVFSRTADGSDI